MGSPLHKKLKPSNDADTDAVSEMENRVKTAMGDLQVDLQPNDESWAAFSSRHLDASVKYANWMASIVGRPDDGQLKLLLSDFITREETRFKALNQKDQQIYQKQQQLNQKEQQIYQLGSVTRLLDLSEGNEDSKELLALQKRGKASPRVRTGHREARPQPQAFNLQEIPRGEEGEWSKLKLNECWRMKSSTLLSYTTDLSYSGEAEIQTFVQAAISDAVYIANMMLSAAAPEGKEVQKLSCRREASLLSYNKPDHTVVFECKSEIEIFTAQDKKPYDDIEKIGKVNGQMYDFLGKMHAFGHPNPFGVLTTFEQTWVAWIDAKDLEIATQQDRFSRANVAEVAGSLAEAPPAVATGGKAAPFTPPPAKPVPAPAWLQADIGTQKTTKVTYVEMSRKVYQSKKAYAAHLLVPLLVNAIFCGLQNFNGKKKSLSIEENIGKGVTLGALKLTRDDYKWVTATVPKVQGETATKPSILSFQKPSYYAFEVLGVGETSRAFRAFDDNGNDCVIKMYIRKFVDNKPLTNKEFESNAKASVKREVDNFHKIYGKEWKQKVWHTELNEFQCVIMPYFKPVAEADRKSPDVLAKIYTLLEQKFKRQSLCFAKSDMLWRHVGIDSNGDIILFDLADLEKKPGHDYKDHLNFLQSKAA